MERRIQEQQDRMKREFDEEQAKKKAKEQAVNDFWNKKIIFTEIFILYYSFQKLKRQEEMARRQQEIQKEAEKQKKEAAERKFQERREQRERRRQDDHHDSDGNNYCWNYLNYECVIMIIIINLHIFRFYATSGSRTL